MDRLISVIVPVYNVEKWLDRCVSSIVSQTYSNIEILLIDDGSPDNCPQMCDEWARKDSRIRVVHKKNGGLSDARNVGINEAKGEYILFVDSDDYIEEVSIERFNSYIIDEDIILGEATIYYNNQVIHRCRTNLEENKIYTGAEVAINSIHKGEWFAAICYNMYRRKFLISNDLYFKVGILHEDNEIQPRMYLKARKVKFMKYEFYKYMIRDDSISKAITEKNKKDLFYGYENWLELNKQIEDKDLYKAYSGALCKSFIHTCREHHYCERKYPGGITAIYLIKNALNVKELIKTIVFIFFPKIYVRL